MTKNVDQAVCFWFWTHLWNTYKCKTDTNFDVLFYVTPELFTIFLESETAVQSTESINPRADLVKHTIWSNLAVSVCTILSPTRQSQSKSNLNWSYIMIFFSRENQQQKTCDPRKFKRCSKGIKGNKIVALRNKFSDLGQNIGRKVTKEKRG